jgi:DNA-binding transcriptional MerR regulator
LAASAVFSRAKLLHMMTVKEVASRLGLSEWAARRLLYACRPLLNGLQGYGSHGEWLINPQAIPILERAKELRVAGIRLQELCSRLAQEMKSSQNGSPLNGEQACASREQGDAQALIKALQEQIAHLREENAWLRGKARRGSRADPCVAGTGAALSVAGAQDCAAGARVIAPQQIGIRAESGRG